MTKKEAQDYLAAKFGPCGRLIAGSKGRYRFHNPNNVVIFNANVLTKIDNTPAKLWYGDLDLSTTDHNMLIEAAQELQLPLYVMHESDARFEADLQVDLSKAFVTYTVYCMVPNRSEWKDYVHMVDGYPEYVVKEKSPEPDYTIEIELNEYKSLDISKLKSLKYTAAKGPIDHLIKTVHSWVDKDQIQAIAWHKTTDKEFMVILEDFARKKLKIEDEYELHKALVWASMDLPSSISNGKPWHVYVKLKEESND